jgi:hypothetical protein
MAIDIKSLDFEIIHGPSITTQFSYSVFTTTYFRLQGYEVQGSYKLSEYFAKLDDRYILCNETVHTTFGSTSQEDYDVHIAVGTRAEPPQIPGHTNYARSVRQPFPFNTGLRFSREMTVATIGPFQMLRSVCVIDTNYTILRHFLLKLWRTKSSDNSYAPCIKILKCFEGNEVQPKVQQ